jgi:cyanophycin synthetase
MAGRKTAGEGSPSAVSVVRREFSVGGFGFGLRQEFLRAVLRVAVPPDADWGTVDRGLAAVIPASGNDPFPLSSLADRIIHWTAELQWAGSQPVIERGRVIGTDQQNGMLIFALPTVRAQAAGEAVVIVADLISSLLGCTLAGTEAIDRGRTQVAAFVKRYSALRLGGSNTALFLKAAFENKMPWFNVTAEVFQVGMGSRARWLESTLTDVTSAIGMRLARNKVAAAELLGKAGLPVPVHQLAKSAKDAAAIAGRLGYPVVVKPADRDGGVAVAAGLGNEAAVVRAYEAAQKISPNVLVEKHVEGRDYRLVVFEGRMIWALERVPGGVTGDGVSTVAQLIERLNRDPARAPRPDAPLKPLVFDREASELLAEYGMTDQSVPAAGERVRLRRAANVASGGTPEGVFEQVHPDNRALAERAAEVLRLDIAGIDLLIPDVSRSWRETGAAICEVNAQPTIGNTTAKHLYGQILRELVAGDGRIPIALIVGADEESAVPALVARILRAAGLRTGLATSRLASIDDRLIHGTPKDVFTAARTVLLDTQADALVVALSDASVIKVCVPFDRCTAVVLAGNRFGQTEADPVLISSLARMLLPVSLGGIAVDSRQTAWRQMVALTRNSRVVMSSAGAEMAAVGAHLKAGNETVTIENGRLVIGGEAVDLGGKEAGIAGSPEDVALAAAAALSMGYGADIIRKGLAGVRLAVAGAAA